MSTIIILFSRFESSSLYASKQFLTTSVTFLIQSKLIKEEESDRIVMTAKKKWKWLLSIYKMLLLMLGYGLALTSMLRFSWSILITAWNILTSVFIFIVFIITHHFLVLSEILRWSMINVPINLLQSNSVINLKRIAVVIIWIYDPKNQYVFIKMVVYKTVNHCLDIIDKNSFTLYLIPLYIKFHSAKYVTR